MNYFRAISLFVLAGAWTSLSGETTQAEKLSSTVDAALDAVYGSCCVEASSEEKQVKVRAVLESSYDLNVIIRRSIGRNWKLLDEDEQVRVADLVKQLIVKAYIKGLDDKNRPEVTFGETVKVSDKRLEIPSVVVAGDKTFNVMYRLGLMQSGWQIYDIVAEDISVVSNYRQQLDDHFRKGSGAELIAKLEELLKKEDLDENIEL
jgi:phospholipid transport system substrate-binding protein